MSKIYNNKQKINSSKFCRYFKKWRGDDLPNDVNFFYEKYYYLIHSLYLYAYFRHILDIKYHLVLFKGKQLIFFISCLIDNFFFVKLIINFFKALNKKSNRQKIIKKYTYFDSGYRPWWNQETQA